MDIELALKILAASAAATLLGIRIVVAWREDRASKRHALDAFVPLIEGAEPFAAGHGYVGVRGRLDGEPVIITAFADTLVLRALPVLYVEVRRRCRYDGRLRVIVNPTGTEYFAGGDDLRTRLVPPPTWSVTTEVCGSGPEALPLMRLLGSVDLASWPKVRQVLVAEDGLRITMKAGVAHRQTYRVLRAATFEPGLVDAALAEDTIGLLRAVEQALIPEATLSAHAHRVPVPTPGAASRGDRPAHADRDSNRRRPDHVVAFCREGIDA